MTVLALALAGGLGSALRFLFTTRWRERGTLAVNLVGSAVLGALVGAEAGRDVLLVAGVGFCGGLTTFSTYAVEVVGLAATSRRHALGYALGTVAACVGVAAVASAIASA